MSVFKTGCCGADFKTDEVTFTGLWSLSVPLIYVFAPAAALGPLLGEGRLRRFVRVLLTANLDLVRRASLIPGARCSLAGTLYNFSPRLSGVLYRYFNFILLSSIWAGLLTLIAGVSRLLK